MTSSNDAVRGEQDEQHGDTSHIRSLGARSDEEMDVVRCKQAGNVHSMESSVSGCELGEVDVHVRSMHCHQKDGSISAPSVQHVDTLV